MVNRTISLKTERLCISGSAVCMVIAGILGIYENTILMDVVRLVISIAALVLLIASRVLKKEMRDEMAIAHMKEANQQTLNLVSVIFAAISVYVLINGIPDIDFRYFIHVPFCLVEVLKAYFFIQLENDGDL